MANLKLSFDEYIPLRDIVFKTLREAIITGDLKPGERLMEIMTARKGAEVAPINEKDLREVLEIRRSLESLACELACKNIKDSEIKKMKSINGEINNAIEAGDIELITQKDVEFHEVICIA
ncbi:MAG: GntR family transcriptional regulator, partial [Lachnospiraceae bacterium]|nr:GntR family transcriptional regulator [Lachnospiraceae bacterium]